MWNRLVASVTLFITALGFVAISAVSLLLGKLYELPPSCQAGIISLTTWLVTAGVVNLIFVPIICFAVGAVCIEDEEKHMMSPFMQFLSIMLLLYVTFGVVWIGAGADSLLEFPCYLQNRQLYDLAVVMIFLKVVNISSVLSLCAIKHWC